MSSASYAVIWREDHGTLYAGRLDLEDDGLRVEGRSSRGETSRQSIDYENLSDVELDRANAGRLAGRPAIRLERRRGAPIQIGSVDGRGALAELIDLLLQRARRQGAGHERT